MMMIANCGLRRYEHQGVSGETATPLYPFYGWFGGGTLFTQNIEYCAYYASELDTDVNIGVGSIDGTEQFDAGTLVNPDFTLPDGSIALNAGNGINGAVNIGWYQAPLEPTPTPSTSVSSWEVYE